MRFLRKLSVSLAVLQIMALSPAALAEMPKLKAGQYKKLKEREQLVVAYLFIREMGGSVSDAKLQAMRLCANLKIATSDIDYVFAVMVMFECAVELGIMTPK